MFLWSSALVAEGRQLRGTASAGGVWGSQGGRAGGVGQTGCRNRQAPSAGISFSLRWVPASQKIQLFLITGYEVCMTARFVVLFSVFVRWSRSGSISLEHG